MKSLKNLFSKIYAILAKWRVKAYQKGIFRKHKINIPVVSVGNLTFGGTGKTPVTEFLMRLFIEKGQRPGIACRAYKARQKKVQRINPRYDQAMDVGDEALMLARRFPQSPIYSGRKKWQVAEIMSQTENITMLILDDGFQHLALERNLDIVLLDANEKPGNYFCFPVGRAREPWSALARGKIIFLTKCNLASLENLEFHRRQLKGLNVFEFNYKVGSFENFKGQKAPKMNFKKVLLVSAIARPQSFQALIQKEFPELVIESMAFSDHHSFRHQDLVKIRKRLNQGFDAIFVTEKDFVKLKDLRSAKELPIWQVQLELQHDFSVESLYAKLHPFFI